MHLGVLGISSGATVVIFQEVAAKPSAATTEEPGRISILHHHPVTPRSSGISSPKIDHKLVMAVHMDMAIRILGQWS